MDRQLRAMRKANVLLKGDYDKAVELLEAIREWLADQADVNYEGTGPNTAMRFCIEIDELIGEPR